MVQTRTSDTDTPDAATTKIAWLLPVLSVLWLLVKLWASHGQIHGSADGFVALATAAGALPGVVQAAIVAGAGAALLTETPLTKTVRLGTVACWLIRLGAGLIVGAVAAVLVKVAYPHLPAVTSIGVTLVVASLIGAALVGIPRIARGVAAGITAMLAALVMTTFLNSNAVLSHMLTWFGAGTTPESVVHASKLVQYADYTLIGIVAGLASFLYLRRASATWFPLYLIGGALPGLLLLLGLGLTAVGGASLQNAANGLSEADRILNQLETQESIPNAMIVLFVGAFVALIAYGRTLKPATAATPTKAAAPSEAARSEASRSEDAQSEAV